MEYKILIAGWGTKEQLVENLRQMADGLHSSYTKDEIARTWEDSILYGTISEHEDDPYEYYDLKVGNKAKVVGNMYNTMVPLGTIVTILDPNDCDCDKDEDDDWPFLVRLDDGLDETWMNEADLELI